MSPESNTNDQTETRESASEENDTAANDTDQAPQSEPYNQKMKKKAKKIIQEFKDFISRGSVIDLSIGLIMGTAFTAIVNSLVKELFMPLFSFLISGIDFSSWKVILKEGTEAGTDPTTGIITDKAAEIAITFGNFLQQVVNFLILGVIVFIMVKAINKFRNLKDAEEKEEAQKKTSEEILLLREIRDLLKSSQEE